MARLTREELKAITGRQQPAAQSRWFKLHLGIDIPTDRRGPIITPAAFDALVSKRCGLWEGGSPAADRPMVKLVKKHATA